MTNQEELDFLAQFKLDENGMFLNDTCCLENDCPTLYEIDVILGDKRGLEHVCKMDKESLWNLAKLYTSSQAARLMHMTKPAFKTLCRENDISYWPQRNFSCMRKLLLSDTISASEKATVAQIVQSSFAHNFLLPEDVAAELSRIQRKHVRAKTRAKIPRCCSSRRRAKRLEISNSYL